MKIKDDAIITRCYECQHWFKHYCYSPSNRSCEFNAQRSHRCKLNDCEVIQENNHSDDMILKMIEDKLKENKIDKIIIVKKKEV